MKKLNLTILILVALGGSVFSQFDKLGPESGLLTQKSVYLGNGFGAVFPSLDFAGLPTIGSHVTILFPVGMLEIGAELGVYYNFTLDSQSFVIEIPIDVALRLNLDSGRFFAFEFRTGGWLIIIPDSYASDPGVTFGLNAGARFVISYFYLGGDIIISFDNANFMRAVLELGFKYYL